MPDAEVRNLGDEAAPDPCTDLDYTARSVTLPIICFKYEDLVWPMAR